MNTFTYTDRPSEGIVQIPITLLRHHPDNPRKDLGDLTELAASIKAKGVMQNLTVVPFRDEGGTGCYHVVIGNRRMEAAKAAGLQALPCVIADMTIAEQVQTMLLENMQRVDLTVYEQAAGFQMMMDFGDSVENISEKTGFSESTVRRRLKMAELDADTLKKVSERQLSLADFDKLSEIEDLTERNKVLEHIGTSSFEWQLKSAKDNQAQRKLREAWIAALDAAGFVRLPDPRTGWSNEYTSLSGNVGTQVRMDQKSPDDLDPETYEAEERFYFFDFNWIYFRKKKTEIEPERDSAFDKSQEEIKQRTERLEKAHETAYELRLAFIKGVHEQEAKRHFSAAISAVACKQSYYNYFGELEELFGCEGDDLKAAVSAAPYKTALLMGFVAKHGMNSFRTFDYLGRFQKNDGLRCLYDFLTSVGYDPSDEESALVDGTSELYLKEDAQ